VLRNILIVIVAVVAAWLVGKFLMFTFDISFRPSVETKVVYTIEGNADQTTPPKKAEKSDCLVLCEATAAGIRTASVDTDDKSCLAACDAVRK
jgi:hypothetical protein